MNVDNTAEPMSAWFVLYKKKRVDKKQIINCFKFFSIDFPNHDGFTTVKFIYFLNNKVPNAHFLSIHLNPKQSETNNHFFYCLFI